MRLITIIILTIVLILIVSVATGFLTKAAADLLVGNDPNTQKAHTILTAAATFGWISIALIILAAIVTFFSAPETKGKTIGSVSTISLVFILLVFLINGILAVVAAVYIKKGNNFNDNKESYQICAWVGGVFVGIAGLVILYQLYLLYAKKKEKEKQIDELTAALKYKSSLSH